MLLQIAESYLLNCS